MIVKYLLPFILLLSLISCSKHKSFDKQIVLKPVPTNITSAVAKDIAKELSDFSVKIEAIDADKILSQLDDDVAKKDDFRYRMLDLRITFNKSIYKLKDLDRAQPKDKIKKIRELRQLRDELNDIWQYLIVNYKI